ncbi:MGMT family protein [Metabacillus sp. Hm71]|uniref:MGMT family protein n=1 Tax=Metabacillus sp. Hm71 TaxID=3450743 RepID=UPI003F435363
MLSFTERVIKIIQKIPPGKVMTYGQIASLAGSPRGARQVVRILHSMSAKYQLPWHRVINAKGEIAFHDEEMFLSQKEFLEDEGVMFKHNHIVDLKKYQFHPLLDDEIK